MWRFLLVVLLLALPEGSAGLLRSGGADLRVSLKVLAEARLDVQDHASDAAGRDAASIRIGDPVSIRVRLWNAGDAASEAIVRLWSRSAPMRVVVTRPDGSSVEAPWEARSVICVLVLPRAMQAGEEHVVETFLFERRVDDDQSGPRIEYLFEEPGRYQIHAEYWAGDPSEHFRFLSGERADRPSVLVSAPVVVDVAEPQIPGWQQLKDAQILHYAGQPKWPQLTDSTSPINGTVDAANRPWLNRWRDQLLRPKSGE